MLNERICFDVIYFDFKNAFETVTHDKLLAILPAYRVGHRIVAWIKAYLLGRRFRVKVRGAVSSECEVTSGCPQGTYMGPLMYLLYIDSLKNIIPHDIGYKVYADDTKLFGRVDSEGNVANLRLTLRRFEEWCDSLDLMLSAQKCVVLHFGKQNQRLSYEVNGCLLQSADTVKDLGVVTNPDLKYGEHCADVAKRAARQASFLIRAFIISNPALYVGMFNVYVKPILMYA